MSIPMESKDFSGQWQETQDRLAEQGRRRFRPLPGFTAYGSTIDNADDARLNGFYQLPAGAANVPFTATPTSIEVRNGADGRLVQILRAVGSGVTAHTRGQWSRHFGVAWSPWVQEHALHGSALVPAAPTSPFISTVDVVFPPRFFTAAPEVMGGSVVTAGGSIIVGSPITSSITASGFTMRAARTSGEGFGTDYLIAWSAQQTF